MQDLYISRQCLRRTFSERKKAIVDSRLCPRCPICCHCIRRQRQTAWRPLANTLEMYESLLLHGAHVHTVNATRHSTHYGKNLTSFTKPEVHNALRCRPRRLDQLNLWSLYLWFFEICELIDKQTDIQSTDTPLKNSGSEVNIAATAFYNIYRFLRGKVITMTVIFKPCSKNARIIFVRVLCSQRVIVERSHDFLYTPPSRSTANCY